ncbi:MgtC/SapB family protein [bacterium]|nr:MgtC/SapB family protein [bacterium]
MFQMFTEYHDFIVQMMLASVLGAVIGLERDIHGRAAGIRTHLLVSLGACVFTIVSLLVARRYVAGTLSHDPGRIAAQIVTGIGFLGAGVIIKAGVNVRGLTTAACLWTAAAVGMACGGGYKGIAVLAAAIALFGLILLKYFERLYPKDSYRILIITTPLHVEPSQIIAIIKRKHLKILNCDVDKDYKQGTIVTRLSIRLYHRGITDKLSHGIIESLEQSCEELIRIRWEHT